MGAWESLLGEGGRTGLRWQRVMAAEAGERVRRKESAGF